VADSGVFWDLGDYIITRQGITSLEEPYLREYSLEALTCDSPHPRGF
jgi:hypothetical protein